MKWLTSILLIPALLVIGCGKSSKVNAPSSPTTTWNPGPGWGSSTVSGDSPTNDIVSFVNQRAAEDDLLGRGEPFAASVEEVVVPIVEALESRAQYTTEWLLAEYPNSGAFIDPLFPEVIWVDEIPKGVREESGIPVMFRHKGQPHLGNTTFYAGMEVAEVFSWWQNPRKWTLDEYSSVAATLIAGYFAYDQYIKSDSAGPPNASGEFSVGPSGVTGDFEGVNGTVNATFTTTKTEGEEASESTTSTFVIEQKP
jgi:hypothetical protein